jgi:tetratricopeptide (TPR) repeat protein
MDYRLEQLRFELQEDPSSRVFFKLGEHLRRVGELDEAIEVLRNGLQSHPHYVSAWVSLGRALHDQGESRGAWQAFAKALEIDPENGVAARCAGEAAIANGDWIEAVKNLKRARGMMPQDDTLDERIVFVEERLQELGMLEVKAEPEETAAEGDEPEVFSVASQDDGDPSEPEADDVFESSRPPTDPPADDPFDPDPDPELPPEPEPAAEPTPEPEPIAGPEIEPDPDPVVVSDEGLAELEQQLSVDEEPEIEFIVDDGTDSVSMAAAEEEPEPIVEDRALEELAEVPPVTPPPPDLMYQPETPVDPDPDPDPDPEPFVASEPEPFVEAPPETLDDPLPAEPEVLGSPIDVADEAPAFEAPMPAAEEVASEIAPPAVAGGPIPTMTLARLAVEQGDFELAESTARGVLERDPGSSEAQQMLEWLASKYSADTSQDAPADGDERSRALRRWLEAVRLAAEKLES